MVDKHDLTDTRTTKLEAPVAPVPQRTTKLEAPVVAPQRTTKLEAPAAPRPRTTKLEAQVAPRPRHRDQAHEVPARPIINETTVLPPPRLSYLTTLGEATRDKFAAAIRNGDNEGAKRAAKVGAVIGLDHDVTRDERKRADKKRFARFTSAIKSARLALASSRKCKSESDVKRALAKFSKHVARAVKSDPLGRPKSEILEHIGTDDSSLAR